MTVKNPSNLAASVQARLQNHARRAKRPFQELLQYYAMERFLYRLSTTSTLAQWTAFRKKLPNTECPERLADVVPFLSDFLLPIGRACESGASFEGRWPPGGPWTADSGERVPTF